MSRKQPAPLAQQLLDAQVAWWLEQLEGEPLAALVDAGLERLLDTAGQLRLRDVVRAADLKAVARKYAVEFELGGEMPALVAQIARDLYDDKALRETTLAELVPDRQFDELLDKLMELEELRTAVVHASVTNPVFSALIAELLYSGIRDYIAQGGIAARLPGARSALKLGKAMVARAGPELTGAVEEGLKGWVHRNTSDSMAASEEFLLRMFEGDAVREALRELWDEHKHNPVSDLRGFAVGSDIEDLFVILYEGWRHMRGSALLGQLLDSGIDSFWRQHRDTRLDALLEVVGISRAMMREDALRFAPPAIAGLKRKKLLEPLIREQLAPFYESDAVRAILAR